MLIIGLGFLIAGCGSFFWSAPKMDAIRSGAGQLAMGLSGLFNPGQAERNAQEIQMYQTAYYGGIIAMIIGGILIAAAVARMSARKAATA